MSLKSSRTDRFTPGSPKLASALARLEREPSRENRADLVGSLLAGPLLLAVHDLPDAFDPSAADGAFVRFVTGESGGRRVVCAFSSANALAVKAPAAVALAVDPASVLDWIVASNADGLLLDPGGASAFVSNDDARRVLGLPPRPAGEHRSISLGDEPEKAVREALEALLETGGAGIEVRERRTGKSIRFEPAEGTGLRMIVPAGPLAGDERDRAEMLFAELAGHAEDLPELGDAKPDDLTVTDFQALFGGDLERPARAAVKVFTWVFGFPAGFDLEIEVV